ncbi:MAG: AbrB/MazE/SpoVT family DNA-binding domain-containing protein [Acidiferrobacter sp.]
MRLQIAKWGNSLAVRLPAECLRATGLKVGDSVEAVMTPEGGLSLVPVQAFDKEAFLKRIRELHASMPMSDPVVGPMRREERY